MNPAPAEAPSSAPPPTIAYPYAVDGVLLRVLEAGSGPETIVLLHGVGARADRWRRNIGAFATAGYRVFAIDFPGHGFSDKRAAARHGAPAYASLVRDFASNVAPGRPVILIGTSLGGHVAAIAALANPAAIRSLVLVGPIGLRPLGADARRRIAESIVDTSLEGIRQKLSFVLARKDLITPEWVEEENRINTSPGAAEALAALAAYFAEQLDDDVLSAEQLRALVAAVPTMLVWGADDAVVPIAVADELERALGVPLVRITSAGHLPYLESPHEFNDAVLAFLSRH
jgi:2-hydroxy-6-oxonona-2,4-dienedioate hydrolase